MYLLKLLYVSCTLYVYKVEAYVKLLPSTYRKKVSLDLPLDDYMHVIIWSTFDFASTVYYTMPTCTIYYLVSTPYNIVQLQYIQIFTFTYRSTSRGDFIFFADRLVRSFDFCYMKQKTIVFREFF